VLRRVSHLDHPSFPPPFSVGGLSVFAACASNAPYVFPTFFDYVQIFGLLLILGPIVPQILDLGSLIGTSVEN